MPDRFEELTPYTPPPTPATEPTRTEALRTAARWSKTRYQQILTVLAERPRCIFEVAAAISAQENTTVHDHQISGRFGTLEDAGLITRSDARRPTPTGCSAAVYQLTLSGEAVLNEASNPLQTGVK